MILFAFCKFICVYYAFIFFFDILWKEEVIFSFCPKNLFRTNCLTKSTVLDKIQSVFCIDVVAIRGGGEYTKLEAKAKDTKKIRGQGQGQALPRTDPLEAKDRNARGQGRGPRTQAEVFSEKIAKKGLQHFFSGDLKKKVFKKCFRYSPVKNAL